MKHSYWLHSFPTLKGPEKEVLNQTTVSVIAKGINTGSQARRWLSLRTVPVMLSNGQRKIEVNALLDDASTISYISTKVKDELELEGSPSNLPVSVIGGKNQRLDAIEVFMTLGDIKNTFSRRFRALALDNVVGKITFKNLNLQY